MPISKILHVINVSFELRFPNYLSEISATKSQLRHYRQEKLHFDNSVKFKDQLSKFLHQAAIFNLK